MSETCAHCGQTCGDYDGGHAATTTPDGTFIPLCHPNAPGRPDCYRRVTVYREPLGALAGVQNKPEGVDECSRPLTGIFTLNGFIRQPQDW